MNEDTTTTTIYSRIEHWIERLPEAGDLDGIDVAIQKNSSAMIRLEDEKKELESMALAFARQYWTDEEIAAAQGGGRVSQ